MLRRSDKPVMLVANKVDNQARELEAHVAVVARPRRAVSRSRRCTAAAPATCSTRSWTRCPTDAPLDARATGRAGRAGWRWSAGPTSASPACSTGWPARSGRSSTRSPAPPSTRSTAWSTIGGEIWQFVDTAGLRKRVGQASGTEYYASPAHRRPRSRRPRSRSCCSTPASRSASRTSGSCPWWSRPGAALVIAFNKWDLVDDDRRYYLDKEIDRELQRIPWAMRVNISAKTGRAVDKLAPALRTALAQLGAARRRPGSSTSG